MTSPVIIWFRQDLRLSDNPALLDAVQGGRAIIPLYIIDDETAGDWKMGAASCVWLHHSLVKLNESLDSNLVVQRGNAAQIIPKLIHDTKAAGIYWNRCYEPWRIERDKAIKSSLQDEGIEAKTFNGSLLWEPWTIKNKTGEPYKVFTPYYKKGCLVAGEPAPPLPSPEEIQFWSSPKEKGSIDDLDLLPPKYEGSWHNQVIKNWDIGEGGALKRLDSFLEDGLRNYKDGRNVPSQQNVSRLSPYLHWGEISPRQVWHTARSYAAAHNISEKDIDHFCSELGWREFSHNLLYHFPHLPTENLQHRFDQFPWSEPTVEDLQAWQKGETGYPIVDAGMRELYQTGYMHNRTRMIVGSFLVKNMLTHWHHGERWFWDCLFDADLANNSASWQWIAGCGADAAPYFRIFNPITQGEKFDPEGEYVRRYVPELKDMPNEFIHKPWEASPLILKAAGVELGKNYPHPMMAHKDARERALEAFAATKT